MDEFEEVPSDIQGVLFIKREIEILLIELDDENLKNALKHCDQYLINHCPHQYITDLIDIDPEKSQTICYCKLCFMEKRE
jgi:hypothetical protein